VPLFVRSIFRFARASKECDRLKFEVQRLRLEKSYLTRML
jgi:hypothetical protein